MPLKYNGVTTKFGDTSSPYYSKAKPHRGVDLGWNSSYGGQYNTPVYAVNDGEVILVGTSTGSGNAGNYIYIRHSFDGNYDLLSRYCHLKDNSIKVKKGQKVKMGEQIATMGGTYGYAVHLHYEMWKVPKSWKYNYSDRTKYVVNPLLYTFADDGQKIGTGEDSKAIVRLLGKGKKAKKDTSKNQIEVTGYQLRIRKGAGTNQTILGYIDYGIYDYTETKVSNSYTWYNIGIGWVAGTKAETKVYPKEEVKEEPKKDTTIEELNKKMAEYEAKINSQKTVIEEQKVKIEELTEKVESNPNLRKYTSNKSTYIKLKTGEQIYF
jgi:hypothetical protein